MTLYIKMALIKNLLQLNKKKISFFTTPTHSQKMPFESLLGKNYYNLDLSEVDGLDNLNNPQECILETETKFQTIYNSGFTHILTNGSTQGLLALMLAVLSKGDKVLVAVNSHKSIHNGLVLTGAEPVWIYPNYDNDFGIYTTITIKSIERAILNNPTAKCLIITNPTYDGIISDIEKISVLCKANDIILIVDEAHGALWNFDKTIGTPAIICGADASVQSLHKTCGAVTPSALLHLSKESKIDTQKVMSALNLISTTSPSYAIMTNIEETVDFLNAQKGKKVIDKLLNNLYDFTQKVKHLENLQIYNENIDVTKILIRFLKLSAEEASEILYSKFKNVKCINAKS